MKKADLQNFVTKTEFESQFKNTNEVLLKLIDTVDSLRTKTATPVETKEVQEVSKAKHNEAPMNPEWEEDAKTVIGEAVDHCEVFYPKGGGTIYTVVIKPEFSNAPKDYLERMGADRRSREIGSEGFSGVQLWNKLIKANLKRGK